MTALSFSLTQLQYFVTAAHTLNLTQAARECHVSQPSISGAVHHLKETFQTELFIAILRGVSWYDIPGAVRSAFRYGGEPGPRISGLGFRLAQD